MSKEDLSKEALSIEVMRAYLISKESLQTHKKALKNAVTEEDILIERMLIAGIKKCYTAKMEVYKHLLSEYFGVEYKIPELEKDYEK